MWRGRIITAMYGAAAGALSTILVLQQVASTAVTPSGAAVPGRPAVESGADGGTVPLYPAYPELQPLPGLPNIPDLAGVFGGGQPQPALPAVSGIPVTVLRAYQRATDNAAAEQPGCHLPMPLLAAIGQVESGHARAGNVDVQGTTRTPILGPRLDGGPGVAAIRDTDGGAYDGDTAWDRAVGPMQFIPSTWRRWAADGNADGVASPHNVFDASLAAARYLCAAGGDVATPDGLRRAILAYNDSESYLNLVLAWMRHYADGTMAVPDTWGPAGNASPVGARNASYQNESRAPSTDDGRTRSQPADRPGAEPPAAPPPAAPPPAAPAPPPPADGSPPLPNTPSLPAPPLPPAPSAVNPASVG